MQPSDVRGRPICPVCFQPVPMGDAVIRGTDELTVHHECHDRVMSWRPTRWPADNAQDSGGRRLCPLCAEPIPPEHPAVRQYGYMLHGDCWLASDAPALRIHVSARDWDERPWRHGFEADLNKMGWGIVAVEAPIAPGAEIVYVVVLESAKDAA